MDIKLAHPAKFEFLEPEELFDRNERTWRDGRMPRGWLGHFARPIVILRADHPRDAVTELAHDALGYYCEDGCIKESFLNNDVMHFLSEEYDYSSGDLPVIPFEIRPGGVRAWRDRAAHFLAHPCDVCGSLSLGYWLQTREDVRRACGLEASHPAIPFLSRKACVQFERGSFLGCFCRRCMDNEAACREVRFQRREDILSRQIARRAKGKLHESA